MSNAFITADSWTTAAIFLTSDLQQLPTRKIELAAVEPTTCYDLALDTPHIFFSFEAQVLTHNNPLIAAALIEPLVEGIVEIAPLAAALISLFEQENQLNNFDQNNANCVRIPTPLLVPPRQTAQPQTSEPIAVPAPTTTSVSAPILPATLTTNILPASSQSTAATKPIEQISEKIITTTPPTANIIPKPAIIAKPIMPISYISKLTDSSAYTYGAYKKPGFAGFNINGSIDNQPIYSHKGGSSFYCNVNASTTPRDARWDEIAWQRFIAQINNRIGEWHVIASNPQIYNMPWFIENTKAKALIAGTEPTDDYYFNNFEDFRYSPYLMALRQSPSYDTKILALQDRLKQKTGWWFWPSTVGKDLDEKLGVNHGYYFFYQGRRVSFSQLINNLAAEVKAQQLQKQIDPALKIQQQKIAADKAANDALILQKRWRGKHWPSKKSLC